jgi:hypothetical protein
MFDMDLTITAGNLKTVVPFDMTAQEWKDIVNRDEDPDVGEVLTKCLEKWLKDGETNFTKLVCIVPKELESEDGDAISDWAVIALMDYYLANAGCYNIERRIV